jgi:hypothetical protein
MEILKRLLEAVRRKMPEFWPNDWILHVENVSAHKALSVRSRIFWSNNRLQKRNIHPVPLIWLRLASGYFQK